VLAAMKKAATFMVDTVAYRGGYVWTVSEDRSKRWGEVPARPTQIWVHGGTPAVGMAFLDAYEATGDAYYLQAARKSADALIFGQHAKGGWHYFIDFDPRGTAAWYETRASRHVFGYEEYRHYYGNATFDDRTTSDAARFLLRFYATTLDAGYRAPVLAALGFVLEAQYPNGAWPQRFPLRTEFAHHGFPDYTSYYTLNDGVMLGNIELLVEAADMLGDARYFEAARRGVDFLIAVQGPEGQGAWAEQYGMDMRPVFARTHEPAGYVVRESREAITALEMFYALTGDRRYLTPIPRCLAWFERINREALELKRPPARYYEPDTNKPVYVVRTPERTSDGYGVTQWTTTPPPPGTRCWSGPCDQEVRAVVDVGAIRRDYEEVAGLSDETARRAYYDRHFRDARRVRRPTTAAAVADVLKALDTRGAWITDRIMVLPHDPPGMDSGDLIPVRGISTATFLRNFGLLTAYASSPRRG
jgi:PelA/Pel-15E family pectate lyase